jgi:SulP family sulfate permease
MKAGDSSKTRSPLLDSTIWPREVRAGVVGAIAGLASVLTLGVLAYAALGPDAAGIGIPASLVATVFGGTLFALLARGPMPAGSPSSAPILILAALVAGIIADPGYHSGRPDDIAALLALTAASVATMGLLQIAIALLGLTSVARFVPQPVLAGFMNGVAIVFVTAQLPALFGWQSGEWTTHGWRSLAHVEIGCLLIGICTMLAIRTWQGLLLKERLPAFARAIPPPFAGLLLGGAAYAIVAKLWPDLNLGGLIGAVPRSLPSFDRLAPWLAGDAAGLLHRHALDALTTAGLMALIGTLDIVLNGLALDQALQTRTEPRRELLALGASNVLSGVLGGLPILLVRARSLVTWRAGGRTHVALLTSYALFALLALVGGPLLSLLPKVVLGGLMVMVGLLLVDAWSLNLASQWLRGRRSGEARLDLALVLTVCIVSVVWGFAIGVAIGAVLAVMVFIRSMNRSLIRASRTAVEQPSRRIYADAHEIVLRELRPSIVILELEGALFFGSTDRLAREVDALGGDHRVLVMDLHRVTVIDASGATVLSQIRKRLQDGGITLLLASVATDERHGSALTEFADAALPATAWHPDIDRAVEAAEIEMLATVMTQTVDASVPLSESSLMVGLDAGQCERVATHLEHQSLAQGECLFAQGDAGDRLYVLTAGSISIVGGNAGDKAISRVRYVTCSPGMMLGEIAMLDRRGRSAEAVADVASEVFTLSEASLHKLETEAPQLATLVYRNIAIHLAARLRISSNVQAAVQRRRTS